MTTNYDLIVIGSGPAGYEGAIYASQLGMKVALIEKEQWLGGTCLNVGCIPAKSMLQSALMFEKAKKFASYGVKIAGADNPELDFPQVNKRRDEIVKTMTNGVGFLMKKNKIDVIRGFGSIAGKGQVEVTTDGKKANYTCKNILIATGSRARHLPSIKVDGKNIVTSEEIWAFDKVPESMAVLGGGVIGCEFASAYGRYGTKVTILEMADQICPTEDHETAAELTKALKKQNCEILTSTKTKSIVAKGNKVEVQIDGENAPRTFDKVLLSVGRAPNVENIGLEKVGIKLDDRGFIPVDLKTYQTNIAGIYAVGDVIPTPQLAHTGSAEALYAVDIIAGKKRHAINYLTNPAAIYTYPEIASIGYTENQLKKSGRAYKATKFPFSAVAKARIDDIAEGFVKILVDPKYGEVLGVHIVNTKASEMISEFALGNNLEMTIEELAHTIHPHPTVSEIIKEAAHAAMGHPINM
ncbi:dihydrolipoyl dehydrogenase [Fluviispira multicolorata]|uniref:Dihydrolipoyl dehydrogenase n=1 Tax=Fluviispira multicolorata TaxID=2654512 RepID=A0A833JFJ5_9BACT|nr:dihydrolipoyl dehydrogenase [Fluviispira multicolorata]KAB8033794.1 dihydrolipoyl dehydrogenase [Fluviispira multicolorata]